MSGITSNPIGHVVEMKTTNSLHYDNMHKRAVAKDDVTTSFSDALMNAVNKVNNLQIDSEGMVQKMIYEPESVDIHQVMIAAQKAEIALSFTRSVRDEAIRAYREIVNMR